jgi:hypothetical protein
MPTRTGHLYLAIDAAVCLITGALIFWRISPRAAEHL